MITLYPAATPNGRKNSIALEELGLGYEVRAINLADSEQKQDWYFAINPNGEIPAINRDFPSEDTPGIADHRPVHPGRSRCRADIAHGRTTPPADPAMSSSAPRR